MPAAKQKPTDPAPSAMATMERQIASCGDRFWRHQDFASLPPTAVSQALSRLSRQGVLTRVRKGLYYRSRPTVLGPSRPSRTAVAHQVLKHPVHPTGATAANLLGLSTQNPAVAHYATVGSDAPQGLEGIHLEVRRPRSREGLTELEGALLETLRDRARHSELDPEATKERLLTLIRREGVFPRLAEAALAEPPRVRAMLGALGQELGEEPALLDRLRASLNRLSRFDFGLLRSLRHAAEWQAK
jgi:hypothetical protein